jgi:polar amino acid transport system substrate-binding protein
MRPSIADAADLVAASPRGRKARAAAVALVWILAWLLPAPAPAQTPFVQDEWRFGRRQDGATLHYCVDERDPDLPVARKIGAAIAGALLLEGKEHAVGEDWSGEDIEQIYQVLLETCDVFLGFKLIPDAYPDWLTITRGYYRGAYVLVTADAVWKSLADVPLSRVIGGTIGTSADIRLIQYLEALKPAERWSHIPVASDEASLLDVAGGKLAAALVWGPSFWSLQQSNPEFAKLRIIGLKPLPAASADVGAVMLTRETYLRTNVDQAIAALTADGTIAAILKSFDFPAAPIQ